jgi:glucokinase
MHKRFVVLSGLPGSGKSTLARPLALGLKLPVLDKDDILEALFESKGLGDTVWRRTLSRDSDARLQAEAEASNGAVLVSLWRVPGMPADSGTAIEWVTQLSKQIVNVHCDCPPEIAARRFLRRTRHVGHLDGTRSEADVLQSLRVLASLAPLDLGLRVVVSTSHEPNVDDVIRNVREAFEPMTAA